MNSFSRLIKPRLPSSALGLTGEGVAVVSLDRRRDGTLLVRRAGYVPLAEGLVRPNFDEPNVSDAGELAAAIQTLAANAGLQKRKRWSVALPEAATRTAILTLEGGTSTRAETEEMLRWKTERGFGTPVEELRVARELLRPDAQGRPRYLATAVRLSVLSEYEAMLSTLGWHTGLILPRHMGEAWWLMRERAAATAAAPASDSLLVSTHHEGFTAVLLRNAQPLLVRSIVCEAEDRVDELYRFLLFYRDRVLTPSLDADAPAADTVGRMMIAGDGIEHTEASAIIEETLNARPRLVTAADVRLALPSDELEFDAIAAPAGLAALAWA
jgi:Tfp pilus assembly PilM family ATPase